IRSEPPCGRGEDERTTSSQSRRALGKAHWLFGGQAGRRPRPRLQKDTDDIREAASIRVIHRLKEKGARVTAYDPIAIPGARQVLGDTVEFAADAKSAIREADCCIVMTEWDEFRSLTGKDYAEHMRRPNVVDARRLYQRDELEGVNVLAIGTGHSGSIRLHPTPDPRLPA